MRKILYGFLLAALSPFSLAETISCSGITILSVIVEGKRDDSFEFQNKLIVRFDKLCGAKEYAYSVQSNPTYNAFLSSALAAKFAGKKVNIAINTLGQTALSNELAVIEISE